AASSSWSATSPYLHKSTSLNYGDLPQGEDLAPDLAADAGHHRQLVAGVVEDRARQHAHRAVALLARHEERLLVLLGQIDGRLPVRRERQLVDRRARLARLAVGHDPHL